VVRFRKLVAETVAAERTRTPAAATPVRSAA